MIVILLGLLDILSAVLLGMMFYHVVFQAVIIIFGVALLLKGIIFIKSLASVIDLFGGAVLLLGLFFAIPPVLFWIAAILLVQKGIMSFF